MTKGIMDNGITTSEENYYFTKGYQQGRADAIEEMIVIIENNLIIDMDIDEHIANRNILIEKLKTLKEQKNE